MSTTPRQTPRQIGAPAAANPTSGALWRQQVEDRPVPQVEAVGQTPTAQAAPSRSIATSPRSAAAHAATSTADNSEVDEQSAAEQPWRRRPVDKEPGEAR